MSDLESVLIKFNRKKISVFNADGSFTKEGYKVYSDFCGLLHKLGSFVSSFDAEQVEKELDLITETE